jgi:hypothetical protein
MLYISPRRAILTRSKHFQDALCLSWYDLGIRSYLNVTDSIPLTLDDTFVLSDLRGS